MTSKRRVITTLLRILRASKYLTHSPPPQLYLPHLHVRMNDICIFFSYMNICLWCHLCVWVWHLLLLSQFRESAYGYVTFEEWIYFGVWLPILYRCLLLFSSFEIIQWQISFQRECLIKLLTQLKPICSEFVQHEQSNVAQNGAIDTIIDHRRLKRWGIYFLPMCVVQFGATLIIFF